MKQILVFAAVFAAMFFMIGCGGDSQKEEGVYLGIIGFNDDLYTKEIGLLNDFSMDDYTDFIDHLEKKDNTLLYFAVYSALKKMRNYPTPAKLNKVALVTFTDGLDNLSYDKKFNPEGYDDDFRNGDAYREGLHDKIVNEPIHGLRVDAYTIGLGNNVEDKAAFHNTLTQLARSDSYAYEVSDMDEAMKKFAVIAEELSYSFTTVRLDFRMPSGFQKGRRLRLTFDIVCNQDYCEGKGEDSKLYIDATYNRIDATYNNKGVLENITYHGFENENNDYKDTINGSKEGNSYHFVFEGLTLEGKKNINKDIIELWKETENGIWEREVEKKSEDGTLFEAQEEKRSAMILLVLDSTSSLGSQFTKMQEAGKEFIKTLLNSIAK